GDAPRRDGFPGPRASNDRRGSRLYHDSGIGCRVRDDLHPAGVGARGYVAHMEQLALGVRIPDRATFASFLPVQNDEALLSLDRFVVSGGGFCWLCGPQASGKTHLLQAVTVAAGERRRASYASLRELLPLGPGALDGLSDLAAIALDDLDAIAGRR